MVETVTTYQAAPALEADLDRLDSGSPVVYDVRARKRIIERVLATERDLARERQRVTALERAQVEMRRALYWYSLGRQDGGYWATLALKDADAPGQRGERGQQ